MVTKDRLNLAGSYPEFMHPQLLSYFHLAPSRASITNQDANEISITSLAAYSKNLCHYHSEIASSQPSLLCLVSAAVRFHKTNVSFVN